MKKAKSKLFYAFAILLGALFVLACLMGFAACGDSDEPEDDDDDEVQGQVTTQRFEAEDAVLWAEEAQLWGECENEITYGSYLTGMGVIFGLQTVYGASGDEAVGYVAHNHPTATFNIKSSKAVTGVKLTLTAASLDIGVSDSAWGGAFALASGWINDYSGADHKILTVNGTSVTLSGTLEGYGSLFNGDDWADSENALAVDHFGTLTATIDLKEGDNEIVLTHDGAGVSWDCIDIETDATLTMTKTDNTAFDSNKGTYVPNTSSGGSDNDDDDDDDEDEDEEETFSRFVTGAYVEGTSTKDYYYYKDSVSNYDAYFTGSEITSVTYAESTDSTDGITGTYTVNGKAAVMDDDQVKAFWGNGYADYIGDEYLTITLLADEGETVTVTTSKNNTFTLNGSSSTLDDTFFTRVQDVTDYTAGKQLYTFTVGGATYEVVLGEVKSSVGSITLEAENAGLFNASGSTSSSTASVSLIGTQQTTLSDKTTITNVMNFNTVGDKIVFQVLAEYAIDNVTIDITAANGALLGGTFADNDKILTVNGGDPVHLEGTLENAALNWSTYGTLTGTISLEQGINYIVLTAASTDVGGYLNVDKIDLSWSEQEVEITTGNAFTGYVTTTETLVPSITEVTTGGSLAEIKAADKTTSLTLEAEEGSLFNAVGKLSGSTTLLKVEDWDTRSGVGSDGVSALTDENGDPVTFEENGVSVGNFNTSGDQIVFEVYSDAAISGVTMTIIGGTAIMNTSLKIVDYVGSDHYVTVNGTQCNMEGTIYAYTNGSIITGTAYSGSWGILTVSNISLQAGINYIAFTYDGAGGLNLDSITLSWTATT